MASCLVFWWSKCYSGYRCIRGKWTGKTPGWTVR